MRTYEGMKLSIQGLRDTRTLADELAKVDKWARQASIAMNALQPTNYPSAIIYAGGGASGNLANHDHHETGWGGQILRGIIVEPYVLPSANAMVVRGLTNQTGDLVQLMDSTATVLGRTTSAGAIAIGPATPGARLDIQALAISNVGLIVNGLTGQTADLQRWNVNNVTQAIVNSDGRLGLNRTTGLSGRLHIVQKDSSEYGIFHVASDTAGYGKTNVAYGLTQTIGDTSGNGLTSAKGINVAQNTTQTYGGSFNGVAVQMNNTGYNDDSDTSSNVRGLQFAVNAIGGYNAGTFYGFEGTAVTQLTGGKTCAALYGGRVGTAVSSSVCTSVYGMAVTHSVSAGTSSTNTYGIHIGTPGNAGTHTNWYGLYVDGNVQAAWTNKWAIYTSKDCPVYFRGQVGVNKTAPVGMLHVDSDATGVIALVANAASGATASIAEFQVNTAMRAKVDAAGKITGTHAGTTLGTAVLNLASVNLTAQNATVGPSNLIASTPQEGWYRVSGYGEVTTAGTAGNLSLTIGWTDHVGATTEVVAGELGGALGNLPVNSTGRQRWETTIYCTASTAITYTMTFAGVTGSLQYHLHLVLEGI